MTAKVRVNNIGHLAVGLDCSCIEENSPFAKTAHLAHIVTNKNDGAPSLRHVIHLVQAFLLKLLVPNREHFVDDKNVGLKMSRNGERETDIHA